MEICRIRKEIPEKLVLSVEVTFHQNMFCFPKIKTFPFSDVTIYAHANSGTKTTRLKKTNKIIHENIIDEIEDVDDEIPDDILANSDDEETSDENRNKKSKKKLIERPNENHVYSDYHIDIWFLISEHISPENVGRFASICRKTDLVVSSPKFWFFMYKKYYNKDIQLPVRFHPDCMVRLGGLRPCTIRSLFYFYKPFVGRLKSMELKDFHCLNNKQCIAMWSNQSKDEWEFCFKFKRKNVPGSRAADSEKLIIEKKIIEMYSDIYMNTEEGCQILVVSFAFFLLVARRLTRRFYPTNFFSPKQVLFMFCSNTVPTRLTKTRTKTNYD